MVWKSIDVIISPHRENDKIYHMKTECAERGEGAATPSRYSSSIFFQHHKSLLCFSVTSYAGDTNVHVVVDIDVKDVSIFHLVPAVASTKTALKSTVSKHKTP